MQLLKQAISERKYEEIGQILRNFEEKSLVGTFAPQSAPQTVDPKVAFKNAFEKGKKLYDGSKLEEAIAAWKEACEIDSDNAIAQKCIVAAENRLKKEKQIRNEVKELLAQCGGSIMKKNFSEAKAILENCEKMLSSSSRLRACQEDAKAIGQKIANGSQDPNAYIAEIQNLRDKL
jgi:SpoU rRNA methylase family enzyme